MLGMPYYAHDLNDIEEEQTTQWPKRKRTNNDL
jgi:hypothetical protein